MSKKTVKTFLLILKRCVTTLTVKNGEQCAETFFDCHDTNLFCRCSCSSSLITYQREKKKQSHFFGAQNLPLKPN